MTTKEDIRKWLERGRKEGATHLIVVCDTFEYEDYPVFVSKSENVYEVEIRETVASMQKVMEVFNLDKDWEEQLDKTRSFTY